MRVEDQFVMKIIFENGKNGSIMKDDKKFLLKMFIDF
jgi:hypothetical protein